MVTNNQNKLLASQLDKLQALLMGQRHLPHSYLIGSVIKFRKRRSLHEGWWAGPDEAQSCETEIPGSSHEKTAAAGRISWFNRGVEAVEAWKHIWGGKEIISESRSIQSSVYLTVWGKIVLVIMFSTGSWYESRVHLLPNADLIWLIRCVS